MSRETFREYYGGLTDDQLAQVVADKQDLVQEAEDALDAEVQKRHFVMPERPQWNQQPGAGERVNSLEDYEDYRSLLGRKKIFGRYWYLVALGPFVLGLVLAKALFENSIAFIVVTLSWALCVAAYGLILNARFLSFECPQCSKGFGRGAECFNCGFPRGTPKR
jgi:hypothetical protein